MNNHPNEINQFRSRLRMILKYWKMASPNGTGKYWDIYSKNISRQVEIEMGDINSHLWSLAQGFSGGAEYPPTPRFRSILAQPLRYINALLRRLPNPFGSLNLFWKLYYFLSRFIIEGDLIKNKNKILLEYGEALFIKEFKNYNISSPEIMGDSREQLNSGRWLSFTTLRNFNVFLQILNSKQRYEAVLEIGAGIGELARIFLSTQTTQHYIIVDIPPAIAFSERYLEKSLGKNVIDYFDPNRTKLNTAKKVHFLTPNQIHLAGYFNLGINVASFGEMTRLIVQNYIFQLKNNGFDEFFSWNQHLKKSNTKETIGELEYTSWFGPEFEVYENWNAYSEVPITTPIPHSKGRQGYQILRFRKAKDLKN